MRILRWLGSIRLGIALLLLLIILLVWGTFIEAVYGAAVARFVLYDSLAFAVLLGAIAVNVTATMTMWRRRWAFLVTHSGIVLLLIGSLLTRQWGEEANLALFEGESGSVAIKSSKCLRITELPIEGDKPEPQYISLPFSPGITPLEGGGLLGITLRWALAWQRYEQPKTFWINNTRIDVIDYEAQDSQQDSRVKLRITSPDLPEKTDVFWLREVVSLYAPLQRDQARWFTLGRHATRIIFTTETLDLGFTLRLHKFIQQNEPGTRMAAGFTSIVEEISQDAESSQEPTPRTVISMNKPGTFVSAKTGRSYRVYQASRSGPYRAGDPAFAQLYGGELFPGEETPREEIWQSVLSVNADPGRKLKYLGCFLLIVGTAAMILTRRSATLAN